MIDKYDSTFFAYVNSGSIVSAEKMLPLLLRALNITSVLDVGCGQGAWLSVYERLGVEHFLGIDGEYVNRDQLLIGTDRFIPTDLSNGFEIGRTFDLVQSLEVAEHLSADVAPLFVKRLCSHSDIVLFSAAPPGQGGDHHINEQPYDFWRKLFAEHGYQAHDFIRPLVADELAIEPWYRYNTFLYVSDDRVGDLPAEIAATRVPNHQGLSDISPLPYKVRKQFVRLMPVAAMSMIAKLKERLVIRARSQGLTQP